MTRSVALLAAGLAGLVLAGCGSPQDDPSSPPGTPGTSATGEPTMLVAPRPPVATCPPEAKLRAAEITGTVSPDAVSATMCGAVYTGALSGEDPPAEALREGVDDLVTALDALPESRGMSCSNVGGVPPVWLVFEAADGSLETISQGDCSGFTYAGRPRDGSFVMPFVDAVRRQRAGEPQPDPVAPTCPAEAFDQAPQSVMISIGDIEVATICVRDQVGGTVETVPVSDEDLATLLADIDQHGRSASRGGNLDTGCTDRQHQIDLIGADAWGDEESLTATFCRSFYNQEIWWFPSEAADTLLDGLIGPVGR